MTGKHGLMGPPRQRGMAPLEQQNRPPRAHVLAAEEARDRLKDRGAEEWKAVQDKRALEGRGGGGVGDLLGLGKGRGRDAMVGGSRTLTRDQLPAALAVASTLHAKGRVVEAERVLSRIIRVCPGDTSARRLLARVTDAINAPLRERGRRVVMEEDTTAPAAATILDGHDKVNITTTKTTRNHRGSSDKTAGAGAGALSRSSLVEQPLLGGTGPPPQQPRRGRAITGAVRSAKVTKAELDAELAAKQARLAAERQADREEAAAMAARAAAEAREAEDKERQRRQDAVRQQKAALDQKRLWDQERFREQWAFEKGEKPKSGAGGGSRGRGGGGVGGSSANRGRGRT